MSAELQRDLEASLAHQTAEKSIKNPVGLRQKMLAIMRDCSYIQKDKENAFHKYRYASEAAIKTVVHAALVKYGVLFQCDCAVFDERTGLGKEGKETLAKCQFHYIFEDVDSGEKREGTFWGAGVDQADKHLYKAITGAIKYILTTTFLIPTGDDPENERPVGKEEARKKQKAAADKKLQELGANVTDIQGRKPGLVSDGQRKRLFVLRNEAKLADDQVRAIFKSYGYTTSAEITVDSYDAICKDVVECGVMRRELPLAGDFKPGNHVNVEGKIYYLNGLDLWEVL